MPKPTPIPPEIRRQIAAALRMGRGRNETARRFNVSAGLVTKVARENAIYLPGAERTVTATQARKIDLMAERLEREEKLLAELDKAEGARMLNGNPTPSRKERRLSYALYNLDRHHDRHVKPAKRPWTDIYARL